MLNPQVEPLHPAQAEIARDNHRIRILVCGRKFGKTTLAAEEIAGCAISKDRARILYLTPTLDDSRRLMWDRIKRKLEPAIIKSNDTRLELKVKTQQGGVADVFLGSWEKVQDYRGDEFDLIVPDECQDYRDFWVGWHEALRPTLSPRKGSALFMGTPKGFNHLYDLFNTDDPSYKSFKFTTYDNPFIPVEEIEEAKRLLNADQFAQEYLADFRKVQGLVYKEFDRSRHVFSEDKVSGELLGGIDFGYRHPAAVMSVRKDNQERYYVTSEWVKTGKTDFQVAEYAASCQFRKVYPDPENPGGIKELDNLGLSVVEVDKGKGSVVAGINLMRTMLKQNRLFVHKSCENLIDGFESWNYDGSGKQTKEKPSAHEPDPLAAVRYIIWMDALSRIPDNYKEEEEVRRYRESHLNELEQDFGLKI